MSEILGTLFKYGVAFLAIGAVLYIAYEGLGSNKVSDEAANISTLEQNAANLYDGATSTASLSDSVMISANGAPNSMVSGTTLINEWGGSVTISSVAANPTEIQVTDGDLPQNACAKLPTVLSSYSSVAVNGGAATVAPVDPGTVATECTAGNTNTLTFIFQT